MFHFLDPIFIIKTLGLIGIIVFIFAESGLFFGFFLPGDSLLFTAGLLSSQGILNIYVLIVCCILAAILGDNVGYSFGKYMGPRIFTKEDSFFFHKKHAENAHLFYTKYGVKAIILARFVPIVRTFAPIVAGVGVMKYRTFFIFNMIGGIVWTAGLTTLGYFLGRYIPNVDKYLLPIIALIIIISFLPIVREWYISRHVTRKERQRR